MSAVTLPPEGAGATSPLHSPKSYEPEDLLDPNVETAEAAASYFSDKSNQHLHLGNVFNRAIDEDNWGALRIIWRHALMKHAQNHWSQEEGFIQAYAEALVELSTHPDDPPFIQLLGFGLLHLALFKYPEIFDTQTLRILIDKRQINVNQFRDMENNPHLGPILGEVLASELKEKASHQSSNIITYCKKQGLGSATVSVTFKLALVNQDIVLIEKLITHQFLHVDQLQTAMGEHDWLHTQLSKLMNYPAASCGVSLSL